VFAKGLAEAADHDVFGDRVIVHADREHRRLLAKRRPLALAEWIQERMSSP
jgi:hypothetical protein